MNICLIAYEVSISIMEAALWFENFFENIVFLLLTLTV